MANILAICQKATQSPGTFSGTLQKSIPPASGNLFKKAKAPSISLNKALHRDAKEDKKNLLKAYTRYMNSNLLGHSNGLKISSDILSTIKCRDTLTVIDGKQAGYTCNKKNCIPCARRRCAELIDYYSDELKKFIAAQFTTLTTPNVKAEDLPALIKKYDNFFKKMSQKWRIAKFRDKSCPPFNAVVAYECTYNNSRRVKTYHLHIHAIIECEAIANMIKKEWLKYFPESVEDAQEVKPIYNIHDSVKELFKYITKFMETDEVRDSKGRLVRRKGLDAKAVVTILNAFKGIKSLKTYGSLRGSVTRAKELAKQNIKAKESEDIDKTKDGQYQYNKYRLDWYEKTTNKPLIGYTPTEKDLEKLKLYAGNAYTEQIEKQLATPLHEKEVPSLPESKPIVIPERNYIVARGQYGEILKPHNWPQLKPLAPEIKNY